MTTFSTTRQLAASPVAVFAAISDAKRLANWWGPNGFTNRFRVFEFQVGGKWIFTMIGPDGTEYANESVFSSITPEKQVVMDHICAPHFQLTITLEQSPTGTLVRWDQAFADATVAQAIAHIIEPANEQNLDRLCAELGLDCRSAE
jgi:uncharacterized protein YndB with AHSA1/START domain